MKFTIYFQGFSTFMVQLSPKALEPQTSTSVHTAFLTKSQTITFRYDLCWRRAKM